MDAVDDVKDEDDAYGLTPGAFLRIIEADAAAVVRTGWTGV